MCYRCCTVSFTARDSSAILWMVQLSCFCQGSVDSAAAMPQQDIVATVSRWKKLQAHLWRASAQGTCRWQVSQALVSLLGVPQLLLQKVGASHIGNTGAQPTHPVIRVWQLMVSLVAVPGSSPLSLFSCPHHLQSSCCAAHAGSPLSMPGTVT